MDLTFLSDRLEVMDKGSVDTYRCLINSNQIHQLVQIEDSLSSVPPHCEFCTRAEFDNKASHPHELN